MDPPTDLIHSVDDLLDYTDMTLFDTPSHHMTQPSHEVLFQTTPPASLQTSSATNSPPSSLDGITTALSSYAQHAQPSPADSQNTTSKRKASDLDGDVNDDDSKANKRQRNTMAARKYRQKRLDLIADLEKALEDMTAERDTLKLQLARKDAEAGALREMLAKK